jgi:bifunctional non-homologous end joining protein LigD
MEGIVAKRKDSVYRPWKRSSDWLKIKSSPQQEFVVGGFTEGKGSRKHLGALLLGANRNGRLHYYEILPYAKPVEFTLGAQT